MDQILHIFRKDVRQHWYVILLSFALLVAFAWDQPRQWSPSATIGNFLVSQALSPLLAPLVVFAWMLLILRVVQAESLVGDRQFWITRPYDWKKLLSAKVLFFIAFINVPLLVVQVALLYKAGYAPASHITGLLWMQILWALFLILPTTTLAAITSGIGQAVLVLLGILVSLIGIVALSSTSISPNAGMPSVHSIWETLLEAVPVAACIAAVLWQYSRRRAAQSRMILIGAAAAIVVIMALTPQQALTDRAYPEPLAGQEAPVYLAYGPRGEGSVEINPTAKNKVWISIPLVASGIAPESAVTIDAIKVSIESPGNPNWNSGWVGAARFLLPGEPHTDASLFVDRSYFDRAKSSSANVHVSFALTIFNATEIERITASNDLFPAPGGASCGIIPELNGFLRCRSPLTSPYLAVTVRPDETTCRLSPEEKAARAGTIQSASNRNSGSIPIDFGISPVSLFYLMFPRGADNSGSVMCPGTPLTFSTFRPVQKTRTELTIENLHLADYQYRNPSSATTGAVGVSVP